MNEEMMRPLKIVCLLAVVICFAGCPALDSGNIRNEPPIKFPRLRIPEKKRSERDSLRGFFHQNFGDRSGVDARAREIEKRLGY